MSTLLFISTILLKFYTDFLLMRVWLQLSSVDFYNPFCQLVFRVTQPMVSPIRRFVTPVRRVDTAALLLALLLTLVKGQILLLQAQLVGLPIILLGWLALMKSSGQLIFWVILLHALLSWFQQERHPIKYPLSKLANPLLEPLRRCLPQNTGIDFSPMLAMLILLVLNHLGADMVGGVWFAL